MLPWSPAWANDSKKDPEPLESLSNRLIVGTSEDMSRLGEGIRGGFQLGGSELCHNDDWIGDETGVWSHHINLAASAAPA